MLGSRIVSCVLILVSVGPALADRVGAHRLALNDGDAYSIAALYARQAHAMAAYAAAMARYRIVMAQTGADRGFPLTGGPDRHDAWTWTSAQGSVLRRVAPGTFRLSLTKAPGGIYSDIECQIREWPVFRCSDGKERHMRAPDISTVIFDDVEFRRTLPASK